MMTVAEWERVVASKPDHDLPRLEYADWLEETAAPGFAERAEFIRLGLSLDTMPQRVRQSIIVNDSKWVGYSKEWIKTHEAVYTPGTARLNGLMTFTDVNPAFARARTRLSELIDAHGQTWFGDLLTFPDTTVSLEPRQFSQPGTVFHFGVQRGFVETVHCRLRAFQELVTCDPDVFRRHPICNVYYTDRSPTTARHRKGPSGGFRWTWFAAGPHIDPNPAVLPPELMPDPSQRRCNYNTEIEAVRAASQRAVEYARSVAFPAGAPA